MQTSSGTFAFVLGGFVFAGMAALGLITAHAAPDVKAFERTVEVKGLAEREVPADIVIRTLAYPLASNDLNELYESIAAGNDIVLRFLDANGLDLADVTRAAERDRPARQGQFSISYRDSTIPHVKNVGIVTTVEYWLSD